MSIRIHTPSIDVACDKVVWTAAIDGFATVKELRFTCGAQAHDFLNPRLDAALVALLMPAMALGEDIVLEGPVTDELVWNLQVEAQEVLRRVRPELRPVHILAEIQYEPNSPGDGVATGFSGGVDSYATLSRYLFSEDLPRHLRVTHLLTNNVGSHGHGRGGDALYTMRLSKFLEEASSTQLPLVGVDSNLDAFYLEAGLEFQPSHTMRNAAVAHLLSRRFRYFYYASSVPYEDVAASPTYDISFADPLILPLLSTRALNLQPAGTFWSRADKTAVVAQMPLAQRHLNVCVDSTDGGNCSECWKCQRTMLTLELLDLRDRFEGVFREPRDPRWQEAYIAHALTRATFPATRELIALYDERVGITPRTRLTARRIRASNFAHRAGRALRRRTYRRGRSS